MINQFILCNFRSDAQLKLHPLLKGSFDGARYRGYLALMETRQPQLLVIYIIR